MNFEQAQAFVRGGRRNGYRRVAGKRSTFIERRNEDCYGLVYHWTTVVSWHRDGTVRLNSGGYETVTTKARINEYSPARVFQQNFAWFVSTPKGAVPFFDGITVDASGNVVEQAA